MSDCGRRWMEVSLGSRLIESSVIGLLAGGWASCTYWQGASGAFLGLLAFLSAMFWLTIEREDEKKGRKKPASHYKRNRQALINTKTPEALGR